MIVLAIDPGSVTAGYAVLKQEGRRFAHVASGILRFDAKAEFLDRVPDIFDQTAELVVRFAPDEIAFESLIFVKSPTALMKLAQARGTMLAALSRSHVGKVFEYAPSLVKSTVAGHGQADKSGIQKILTQYLGARDFATHDESDALAIALCHLLTRAAGPLAAKRRSSGRGLSASLAHKIKEKTV